MLEWHVYYKSLVEEIDDMYKCMLHPHISREGVSNDVEVLEPLLHGYVAIIRKPSPPFPVRDVYCILVQQANFYLTHPFDLSLCTEVHANELRMREWVEFHL